MGKPKSLAEDHRRLLTDEFHCDVNFVVGDDKQVIRAHKLILASRSPVLTAMFYGELKETGEDVELPDTDGGVMQNFLEYLYTDSTDIDSENVSGILYLATKYDVQNLVEECESFCASIITLGEVCNMMNLATNYNLSKLWIAGIEFIVINIRGIFPSNYLDKMVVDTMKKFVACDKLAVDEIMIFECLRSWAEQECCRQDLEYNIVNERSVLSDSLNFVRFPSIKSRIFTEKIAITNVLTAEEEVDIHRSVTSNNKIPSQRFQTCARFNVQDSFGWIGSFVNNDIRSFYAAQMYTLKSVVLRISCSEIVYLRFTTKESTHFGCSDMDFAYEVECPTEYINKYVLIHLPENGIEINRKTDMKFLNNRLTFGEKTQLKGKLEVSNVFEDIEDDKQLNAKFTLKDLRRETQEAGCIKAYFFNY